VTSLWVVLLVGVVGGVVALQVLYLVIRLAVRDGILAADQARSRRESDQRRQEALTEARRTSYRLDPPE
jgi:multidrug efflux pump subunit AcrB